MPRIEFDPCWRRLERAQFHRNAVDAIWNEAIETKESHDTRVYVNDDGTGAIKVEPTLI